MKPQIDLAGGVDRERISLASEKILDWLARHQECFDPLTERSDPDIFRTKAMIELSLFCLYYKRSLGGHSDPRIDSCLSLIRSTWDRHEYSDRVVRNPERLRLYAMAYVALRACGNIDSSFDFVLQRMLDEGYVTAVEEIPFRLLDLRHMLDQIQLRHDLPTYDELYSRTLLAKHPSPIYLTTDDVYAITHSLFYVTDMGFRLPKPIQTADLPEVGRLVTTLLGLYLRRRNWDLVGELLIACHCLRWGFSPVISTAWEALLDAQLDDGSVPGPEFAREELESMQTADERNQYSFKHNYHTTLVCGLAFTLAIRTRRHFQVSRKEIILSGESQSVPPVSQLPNHQSAMVRATEWLTTISESLPKQESSQPIALLQTLVGLWICGCGCDSMVSRSTLERFGREIQEHFDRRAYTSTRAILKSDAALLLVSVGILEELQAPSAVLARLAKRLTNLVDLDTISETKKDDFFITRYLLHRLHLRTKAPQSVRFADTGHLTLRELIELNVDGVKSVAAVVGNVTRFGAIPDAIDGETLSNLEVALPIWLFDALRRYDLELGALLLRFACHLDWRQSHFAPVAANFLIAQQRPDGSFGFMAPEISQLGSDEGASFRELDLQLPITVSIIWALAEFRKPHFRLFESFPEDCTLVDTDQSTRPERL